LPDGQAITVRTDGDWDFPNRSVLMKNFRVGTRLIETRLLMRHPDGTWGGFTYEWNAQQTDATLLQGGANRDLGNGQMWRFPSESQCLDCHTSAANRALGPETSQLNRTLTYTQTNRTANELITLSHIGVLSPPITASATQPAMPDPADTTASLTNRARAYVLSATLVAYVWETAGRDAVRALWQAKDPRAVLGILTTGTGGDDPTPRWREWINQRAGSQIGLDSVAFQRDDCG